MTTNFSSLFGLAETDVLQTPFSIFVSYLDVTALCTGARKLLNVLKEMGWFLMIPVISGY